MDWECPTCGLVNPPSARYCDCGYDVVAKQVDRHHASKHDASGGPGVYESYQLAKFVLVSVLLALGGIGLLLWEFAEGASFWGVVRAVLISAFGFGFLGIVIWFGRKPQ